MSFLSLSIFSFIESSECLIENDAVATPPSNCNAENAASNGEDIICESGVEITKPACEEMTNVSKQDSITSLSQVTISIAPGNDLYTIVWRLE